MAIKNREISAVRFWTPLRLVSTLIVLGLLAAFGASSCNSNDPAPPNRSTASGTSSSGAPRLPSLVLDAELKSTNGEPIKLANYSGKVMVVNLWATWCGPCRRETPELVKLYQEYQGRGVQMIGLSTEDPVTSAQTVLEFVRRYNVEYPIGWATREVALALMQGNTRIPQSFIITRDGRIKERFTGFDPNTTPPRLKYAIEQALIDNG